MKTPIAIELLHVELDRLKVDHYDDGQNTECDGCKRASDIRRELVALRAGGRR